jgi:hypothetical protein
MALVCAMLGLAVFASQAVAAGPPSGLPGPPPGAGTGFPLPPSPGAAPSPTADGAPVTISGTASGPGLLSGTASLSGKRVSIPIACSAGGRVTMSAPGLGTMAQAKYRCRGGRATAVLTLTSATARQVNSLGSVLVRLAFSGGEQLSLALGPRVPVAGTWTSYYGLACNTPAANESSLLAPNFSDTPSTTIDVRPWLAWYTSATGWQWIGTQGANASSWYSWTATPNGVAEWLTPPTTITPWAWAPISVAPGHGTYVIAVFEVIYWYSHPVYAWHYARSGGGPNATVTYCEYP